MDYKKIYDSLISSRKLLARKKGDGNYYESHHILPISLGGNNDESNLVLLTAKEHYLSHLLLFKFTSGKDKNKMVYALWRMCKTSKNHNKIISSKQYEIARKLYIESLTGRKHSAETISKMKEKRKLQAPLSKEARAKISEKAKGRKLSEATKLLIGKNTTNVRRGKKFGPMSDEIKQKISNSNKGKVFTKEHLQNLRKKKSIKPSLA